MTTYKAELEAISRDSRDVEQALTHGAGLVKLSALVEAEDRATQLERSKRRNLRILMANRSYLHQTSSHSNLPFPN